MTSGFQREGRKAGRQKEKKGPKNFTVPPFFPSSRLPAFPLLLAVAFLWGPMLLMGAQVAARIASEPLLLKRVLLLDGVRLSLFSNTLQLGALTVLTALLMGVPCAVVLARGPKVWRALVAVGCALPLALPAIVPASLCVPLTFAPGSDVPKLSPVLLAGPVLGASLYPLVAFALASALRALPAEAEDAARLSAGEFSSWRGVLLPLLRPALLGSAGLTLALALWEMGAPDLLNVPTYAVQIYRDWNAGTDATLAVLDMLPLVALGALALWPALRALKFYERLNVGGTARTTQRPGTVEIACCVVSLLVLALSPGMTLFALWRGLGSVARLSEAWQFARDELFNTALLAPLATLLLLAWAFALVARPSRSLARWLLLLPMLAPPITMGLAMVAFWNRPLFAPVYGGVESGVPLLDDLLAILARDGMTVIGYMARFLPPAVWLLSEATARVPTESREAAQSLGATPGTEARTVLLPATLPAMAGAGAILGALCIGELSVSVLVAQPGGAPLTLPLFNFMHAGEAELVAALSLTLFALGAGVMLFFGACGLALSKLVRR